MSDRHRTARGPRRLIAGFACCALLAACAAPEAPADAPAPPTPTAAAKTSLTVLTLCFEPAQSVLQLMVDAYRAAHPDASVNVECAGNYPRDLLNKTASESPPDVIWNLDLFNSAFADGDLVLDLETFANADGLIDLDDINPSVRALAGSPHQPGMFMVPASYETVQMFYNKSLWEAAGAPLPAADWTWDDLIAACKVIQEKHPGKYCLSYGTAGMPDASWWGYAVPWIAGHGGQIASEDFKTSTFSSPGSLEGIQAYADLWLKHKVAAPPFSNPGGDCFVGQSCAAVFFIPGKIKEYREQIRDFEWDVQVMPAHPDARVTGMGVYGWSVGKRSRQPEAAWDFIKWLLTQDGQRAVARDYLGMPVLKSVEAESLQKGLAPPPASLDAWFKGSSIGMLPPNGYPLACGSLFAGLVGDAYQAAVRDTIRGTKTAQEAFKAADAEIQSCLDQNP